jgi:hypothetical protein
MLLVVLGFGVHNDAPISTQQNVHSYQPLDALNNTQRHLINGAWVNSLLVMRENEDQ